jgi:hypothetical protein
MTYIIAIAIIFVLMLIVGHNENIKKKEKARLLQERILEQQRIEQDRIEKEKIQEQERIERMKQLEEIEKQKTQEEIEAIRNKIDFAFSLKEISETHRNFLLNKLNSEWWTQYDFDKMIDNCKNLLRHENSLISKYGHDVAQKLINQEYWIGMTQQQLIDSKGNPDKIEKEVLKTKTKKIFIYGNKSSGDYFVFENNIVTKFVDR